MRETWTYRRNQKLRKPNSKYYPIGQTINAIFCSRNSKPRCVRWTSRSFLNTKYKTVR